MRVVRFAVAVAVVVVASSLSGCNCGSGADPDAGVDAGRDAGRADAGVQDAGVPDAGDPDAGLPDAGEVDAGDTDAGTPDDAGVDGGAADAGAPDASVVVDVDFETVLPAGLDAGTALLTPSQGYEPLGYPGNSFGPTFLRAQTGNVITMTLTGLPPHTSVSVDFLFAAIDSLDGTGTFPAGDFFRVDIDGFTIFRESFANATMSQIQSYDPPDASIVLARFVDLGFSGPGGFYTDSAYDMSLDPQFHDWPHTASSVTVTFSLEGMGVQDLADESWAIDNLRVTTGNTPRARPDGGP